MKIRIRHLWLAAFLFLSFALKAQNGYWQQYVSYTMDVDMDVKNKSYEGFQRAAYTNRSPDTLREIYYHLIWNVFKPNSSLYWHNKTRKDPDPRLLKLQDLKPEEQGDYRIFSLTQNGQPVDFEIRESILRVKLNEPVAPGETHVFEMKYRVHIPKLLRRSGYDNAEGVDFSMAQWYPKIAEYRPDGWHADPFLGREFFGVWGDFDVTIHIDRDYVVGGSGYLQNSDEIWNYRNGRWELKKTRKKKRTWHFKAPDVHDFSWAADPDYVRESTDADSVRLNFYYLNTKKNAEKWKVLKDYTVKTLAFYNRIIGPYPYKQYSVIQAGDGGMEYAMCTFITGNRTEASLVGVMMHELAHSWFQFVLATDETRHAWMDEGFTTFISMMAQKLIYEKKFDETNYWTGVIETYAGYATGDDVEPMSLFADSYLSNMSYWVNAYDKGAAFLIHLINIGGLKPTLAFLQNYYAEWKFKHPEPEDMLRVAEKTLGMELDWFYNEWVESTHTVDYAVVSVEKSGDGSRITIRKIGGMPVPLDVLVVSKGGEFRMYHLPYFRTLHYRQSPNFSKPEFFRVLEPWFDGYPEYTFDVPWPPEALKLVQADPWFYTLDVDPANNIWEPGRSENEKQDR
ncbi:MAG: M1 family metallopeptidase [Chlorobi bacterium]|nr:M1 family metallopeptidase [Chlorobiota bacterium]